MRNNSHFSLKGKTYFLMRGGQSGNFNVKSMKAAWSQINVSVILLCELLSKLSVAYCSEQMVELYLLCFSVIDVGYEDNWQGLYIVDIKILFGIFDWSSFWTSEPEAPGFPGKNITFNHVHDSSTARMLYNFLCIWKKFKRRFLLGNCLFRSRKH